MPYYSTRDPARRLADLKTALLRGLAPDGGLFMPQQIPVVTADHLADWRVLSFPELAGHVVQFWFGEAVSPEVLRAMTRAAYDFPVPLRALQPGQQVCELFHGPSCSFKDFAAQFLMRLLEHLLAVSGESALVLTATSGDTGSAVAAACHGRPHLTAVICYPRGKISPIQERQITTWGGNVHAVAVDGTFDDCQRLVKETIVYCADLSQCGLPFQHITSANSINVGRLLPQTLYYWYAALHTGAAGERATIVVPCGNFGNLTAGVLAMRMGAPIAGFVAATNVNDAVPQFLQGGVYHAQPTRHTLSNAMDVGSPSNFERLRHLFGDDLQAMRAVIAAEVVDDATTRATMREVAAQSGYLLDPHSAVAWTALRRHAAAGHAHLPLIALATADPAKFPELVFDATGRIPPVPPQTAHIMTKPVQRHALRHATAEALQTLLRQLVTR